MNLVWHWGSQQTYICYLITHFLKRNDLLKTIIKSNSQTSKHIKDALLVDKTNKTNSRISIFCFILITTFRRPHILQNDSQFLKLDAATNKIFSEIPLNASQQHPNLQSPPHLLIKATQLVRNSEVKFVNHSILPHMVHSY